MRVAIAFTLALALASCATTPDAPPPPVKPVSEMTPAEWCANSARLLGNQWLDPFQKQALLEAMRNRGCLGRPGAAPKG
jgi:hypothetical protein